MNYCANVNFLYPRSIKIAKGDVYFEFEGTGFWLTVFDRAPSVTSSEHIDIYPKISQLKR